MDTLFTPIFLNLINFLASYELGFASSVISISFLKPNNSQFSYSHEIGGNDGFVKGKPEKLIYQYDWIFSYSIFSPLISLILDPVQFFIMKLSKK